MMANGVEFERRKRDGLVFAAARLLLGATGRVVRHSAIKFTLSEPGVIYSR